MYVNNITKSMSNYQLANWYIELCEHYQSDQGASKGFTYKLIIDIENTLQERGILNVINGQTTLQDQLDQL